MSEDSEVADIESTMMDPMQWDMDELSRARQRFRETFQKIANVCRLRHLPLDVALIPMRATVMDLDSSNARDSDTDRRLPNVYANTILRKLGINTLDLTPVYAAHPYDRMFFRFDGHLTPEGHQVTAREIKRVILRDLLPASAPDTAANQL